MGKKAYIIKHVDFENLGNLEPILKEKKYDIKYFNAGYESLGIIKTKCPDLVVILGAPISVNEQEAYPFILEELKIIESRVNKDLPTLGICLGAQLIAHVLGGKVYNGGKKEIGWSRLKITEEGKNNYFSHLDSAKTPVLHWHGDTFELPKGAKLQASSAMYQNQAFTFKRNILALQFHAEVTKQGLEKWFIGHACEISTTKDIEVSLLRLDTLKYADRLSLCAKKFWEEWLDRIEKDDA